MAVVLSVYFYCLVIFVWCLQPAYGLPCKQTGLCVCEAGSNKIDLSPLDGKGTAKFSVVAKDHNTYSYNPCSGFSDIFPCQDVSVCQAKSQYDTYPVGDANSAKFTEDGQGLYIEYTSTYSNTLRTSKVYLVCDKNTEGTFTADGETTTALYVMQLTTKYACLPGNGLSPGSIMLIIFFSVLFVYIVAGVLYNKFKKGASGKEIIPHVVFWADVPILIKDGGAFAFTKVRRVVLRQPAYDEIFTGTGDDGDYYEYNPCSGFTDMDSGGACDNVAACQTHIGSYYPIGDVNSATFLQDAQGTYIQYTSTDPGTGSTRTTNVRLTCDKSTESSYTVKGETPSGSSIYEMSLTTKYACLGDSPPPSPSSGPHHPGGGGISIGTILIIVFLSLILVYLVAGSVFNKVKRQETGVAIIPNSSFWKDFPILVKDGAVFVVTKIRGKVGGQGGYESV